VKKRIQNKGIHFFKTVVSLTVLIGFLCIQLHSFAHSHDDHISHHHHHEDCDGHSHDDSEGEDSHNEDETESDDCPTCVLTKHIDTFPNNVYLKHLTDGKQLVLIADVEVKKGQNFVNLSLRGPPPVV
jgi:hypothetical protein